MSCADCMSDHDGSHERELVAPEKIRGYITDADVEPQRDRSMVIRLRVEKSQYRRIRLHLSGAAARELWARLGRAFDL